MMLELVAERPDWLGALGVALALPPGITERRARQDPWAVDASRPRRISDDLAWLRGAYDEPEEHGLRALPDSAAVAAWQVGEGDELAHRFARLRARGILDAAGFLVHDEM
ncbi:MAG: hypothetical protein ABSG43_21655 [Solirubrobacteraceae bacterium]|jgi:hypothetical protein